MSNSIPPSGMVVRSDYHFADQNAAPEKGDWLLSARAVSGNKSEFTTQNKVDGSKPIKAEANAVNFELNNAINCKDIGGIKTAITTLSRIERDARKMGNNKLADAINTISKNASQSLKAITRDVYPIVYMLGGGANEPEEPPASSLTLADPAEINWRPVASGEPIPSFDFEGLPAPQSGPFAGVDTEEETQSRLAHLLDVGQLVNRKAGLYNAVYTLLDEEKNDTGKIVRLPTDSRTAGRGNVSKSELQATVAASRLGIGPTVYPNESVVFDKTPAPADPNRPNYRGYLVIDHVQGRQLSELLSDEGLTTLTYALRTEYSKNLSQLFAKLHGSGFIHGDVNEENVRETDGGFLFIDFGRSKQIAHLDKDMGFLIANQIQKDLDGFFELQEKLRPTAIQNLEWREWVVASYFTAVNNPSSPANYKRMEHIQLAMQMHNETQERMNRLLNRQTDYRGLS
jgi:tRNA A-37 threonylcarbamoyl transferase component Bud32